MPLRTWKCVVCEEQSLTKNAAPAHCELPMELFMVAPATKFMEKTDAEKGKSALVGQQKILKERARKHSRDVEMDDLILNNDKELAHQNKWLKADGTKRRAIDDL